MVDEFYAHKGLDRDGKPKPGNAEAARAGERAFSPAVRGVHKERIMQTNGKVLKIDYEKCTDAGCVNSSAR